MSKKGNGVDQIKKASEAASTVQRERLANEKEARAVSIAHSNLLKEIQDPKAVPFMTQPTHNVIRVIDTGGVVAKNVTPRKSPEQDSIREVFDSQINNLPAPPGDWVGLFTPGLHMMAGSAGTGKSVNALALAAMLKNAGHYVEYHNIMEPRGAFFDDKKLVNEAGIRNKEKNAIRDIPESFSKWLLEGVLPRCQNQGRNSKLASVCILDSITYLLRLLSPTVQILSQRGAPSGTYEGGLQYGDTLGAIHFNQQATYKDTCLIGIINSDLFPPIKALSGAVEGMMTSIQVGRLEVNSRPSGRQTVTWDIPPVYTHAAITRMYGKASIGNKNNSMLGAWSR